MDQREIGAPGVSVGPVDSAGERRSGTVGRADLWLERLGSTILTALFLVMSALGFIQVVCRYFLEYPLYWSEELIRYLFVWTTFLGAGVATAHGLHIEIDILSTIVAKKPPVRKEKILRTIRIISTSLMLIFLAYYAYLASDFLGKINGLKQFSTAMEVNMLWPMSAVLVGALLMLLHYLARFIRDLKANSFEDAQELKERREGR
jgi:TRAP-type C4-dicarboxylate transport system permease small subunit